eukprot:3234318-Lingulodinium_polyedra.AAC.1
MVTPPRARKTALDCGLPEPFRCGQDALARQFREPPLRALDGLFDLGNDTCLQTNVPPNKLC